MDKGCSKVKVQTNLRIPPNVKRQVTREADRMGISFNDYVVLAVREYIRVRKG